MANKRKMHKKISKKGVYIVGGIFCVLVLFVVSVQIFGTGKNTTRSEKDILLRNPQAPGFYIRPPDWVRDSTTKMQYRYDEETGLYYFKDANGREFIYDPVNQRIIGKNEKTGEEYIYDIRTGALVTIDKDGNVIDTPEHIARYFDNAIALADMLGGNLSSEEILSMGLDGVIQVDGTSGTNIRNQAKLDKESLILTPEVPPESTPAQQGVSNIDDLFNPNRSGIVQSLTDGTQSGSSGGGSSEKDMSSFLYDPPSTPDFGNLIDSITGGGVPGGSVESFYSGVNNQFGKQGFLESQKNSSSFAGSGREMSNGTTVEGYTGSVVSRNGNTTYSVPTQYQIDSGTIIPVVLQTGVNTDLPGQLIGVATRNIYDSLTGTDIIIPQGTKFFATYSSNIAFNQNRVLVAWNYLIRPDGIGMSIPGLQGVDAEGFAGYKDQVNRHWWQKIGAVGLATLMNIGTASMSGLTPEEDLATSEAMRAITTATGSVINNIMNRQPTLILESGQTVNIFVNESFSLKPFYF